MRSSCLAIFFRVLAMVMGSLRKTSLSVGLFMLGSLGVVGFVIPGIIFGFCNPWDYFILWWFGGLVGG